MVAINKKVQTLAFQGISAGGLGVATVAMIASFVAFNSEEYLSDEKLGIQMGMMTDAGSGLVTVWARTPAALIITSSISDVFKIEKDGSHSPSSLGGLFPIDEPNGGGGVINLTIYAAEDDEMPDLSKHDQSVIPFAHVGIEKKLPPAARFMMIIMGKMMDNWKYVKLGIMGNAVALIILGLGLRYRNKKAEPPTMVEEFKDDDSVE